MQKYPIYIISLVISAVAFLSCGQDRSGEYYALIEAKYWMYETMQQDYLFYEDLPAEDGLNFFQKPETFLQSVISSKDQKNGVQFSHVDSIKASRVTSEYPSYGFQGALVRNANGDNVVQVLYTYENSPASEAGIKRGDWIVTVNNYAINSTNYANFIEHPTQALTYKIARKNENGTHDTLIVDMPSPRYVEEPSVLLTKTVTVGNRKAFYIMYNSFEEEETDLLKEAFNQGMAQSPTDIILDLRYNPGGYVSTALLLSTILAPQEVMGQTCFTMIPNDKKGESQTAIFDSGLLTGVTKANFDYLYIITSSSTASAAELTINSLRPYLGDKLLQVGDATFGKNVAQSLYTNEAYPLIEFWLTTHYLANSEGFYDYYTNGLEPDYQQAEDMTLDLGELGSEQDILMQPIIYHMANGTFPSTGTDETTSEESRSYLGFFNGQAKVLYNPISHKPKEAKISGL